MQPPRSQTSLELESYWRGLHVSPGLPKLDSFSLLDIPTLIPELIVLDLIDDRDPKAHIKMCGSNLSMRAGVELTGQNFLDLWHRDVRDVVWNVFRKSVKRPCGFTLTTRVQLQNAASAVMEATVVPFQGNYLDAPSIIMSCVWTGVALIQGMENLVVIEIPKTFSWIDLGHGVPERSPIDP